MPSLRCWNVLSWNIRGLSFEKKRLALNNAILSSGCAVVCLQETKLSDVTPAFVKTCCPRQFDQFAFVPSNGASGGIATIWNSSIFTGSVIASEDFALVIKYKAMPLEVVPQNLLQDICF